MTVAPYHLGFSTTYEGDLHALPVQGQIPHWLNGSLIRTGPGTHQVGQQSYHHWFDGLAMLRRFCFASGQVSFANRFLHSRAYEEAQKRGKISRGEFGTTARRSLLERLRDPLPRLTDNATVNITMQGDRFVSVTESPFPIVFDPDSLETLDRFHYQDRVPGQITTAHPHFDFEENALYSYLVNLIPTCSYSLYRMAAHSNQRQLITSIPVDRPAYMHTFAMTRQYLILVEYPLRLSRASLLLSGKPVIENYDWQPQQGTQFLVISKQTGAVVHRATSAPFFAFHHVNAFEQGDEIAVDLIAYDDSRVIQSLYLEPLLHHPDQVIAAGELRRYRIDLTQPASQSSSAQPTVDFEMLVNEAMELPRINYPRCNTRPYQFVYGVGSSQPGQFLDRLVKADVQNRKAQIWQAPDCYAGEPVFVAAPQPGIQADPQADPQPEDAGVVLSVVLNAQTQTSFLLVLDGQSWQELARVQLPYHLPFDFHGQYFDSTDPTQRTQLHR